MALQEITDSSFEQEVLQSPHPVAVHFYGAICQPCEDVYPLLEEVSQQYPHIAFKKMNTDIYRQIVALYGIRGIPTLLVFKDGKTVSAKVGSYQLEKLLDVLRPVL